MNNLDEDKSAEGPSDENVNPEEKKCKPLSDQL